MFYKIDPTKYELSTKYEFSTKYELVLSRKIRILRKTHHPSIYLTFENRVYTSTHHILHLLFNVYNIIENKLHINHHNLN